MGAHVEFHFQINITLGHAGLDHIQNMTEGRIRQIRCPLHYSQLVPVLEHAQILNSLGYRNQHCRLQSCSISRICAEGNVIMFKSDTDRAALRKQFTHSVNEFRTMLNNL